MEGRRDKPRIPPGTREETGVVNAAIARGIGLAAGGPAPHIFTTLGRHRRLFRRWLRFAGALMPGGGLPRHDSELVILRVAHNCGCDYELHHHEALGRIAGLSAEEIERAAEGPEAPGWSERQRLLLRAVDELHADRVISDELWGPLESHLSETDLIELCMLVGHYEMLAMTLNSLGVQRDHAPPNPPRALRAAERIRTRRARQRSA